MESYNPASNAWTDLPPVPAPRYLLAASDMPCPVGVAGNCVYPSGGVTAAGEFSGSLEALDPPDASNYRNGRRRSPRSGGLRRRTRALPVAGLARSPAAGASPCQLRPFLDAGDSVYRGRIENRIRHRNGPPSPMGA
ncbi:hypothetical protein J7F03_19340 [Streptomyces sp. ISL-43]|nr:hypothetical protein [Streptomyces sp. ISL-43]